MARARAAQPTRGAFDTGEVPTIVCLDRATTPLGVELGTLVAAMQAFVDEAVAPVWCTPARLVEASDLAHDAWAMVFLDDADQPGALAYHDLTPDGWPLAKVFVRTALRNGDTVSVAASHELVEMLVDPAINLMSTGPDAATMYAYESADPVEQLSFPVRGIPMSDFVYPSYFEAFRQPGSTRFDHMGHVERPFQILPGGYQIIFKDGTWSQIFGSHEKQAAFAREDRRGHRSEARGRPLVRAAPEEIARHRRRTG